MRHAIYKIRTTLKTDYVSYLGVFLVKICVQYLLVFCFIPYNFAVVRARNILASKIFNKNNK